MARLVRCLPTLALAATCLVTGAFGAAGQSRSRCDEDVARLRKAETELPKLAVAPPGDKQIVCITLETNILFARRLAAHLQQCPRSPLTGIGAAWARTGSDHAAQFSERGCKVAIKH